jgi:midasin (ATPase involved in ribosome maturation)
MLALDDTKSMHYGDVGEQALKGLLAISMALSHLNIKTCVTSIKDNMEVVKSFTDQLNCEKILQ